MRQLAAVHVICCVGEHELETVHCCCSSVQASVGLLLIVCVMHGWHLVATVAPQWGNLTGQQCTLHVPVLLCTAAGMA